MNNLGKGTLVVVGALFLSFVCCCGSIQTYKIIGQYGLERAAYRVGVDPSYEGLADYIVKSVEPGMTRDDVEEILGAIAPLRIMQGELDEDGFSSWGAIACDEIWIDITPFPQHGWPITACYNDKGQLVKMHSVGSDLPPLDIYAPTGE